MITTMRITLALVSLGLLFHCVSSQSIDVISENQTDPIMTPSTTLTTVTSKALTTVLTTVTSEALTTVTSKAPITVPSVASTHTVPPSPSAAAETDPSKPPTQANVVAMKSSFSVAPSGSTATDKPHLITVVTSDPSQNSSNKVLTTVPVTSTSVGLRKLEDQGLDLFTTQGTNSTSHQPAGIPVTHGTQGPTAASDTKMALTPPPTMSTSGQQTTTATLITATATTTTTTTNISVKDTVPGREWTTAQSIKTTIPSPTSAAAGSATVGTHTGVTGLRTKTFSFPMDDRHKPEENDMAVLCTQLMKAIALMAVHNNGSCTLRWTQQGDKMVFGSVDINSKVKAAVVNQYFDEIQKEKSPSSPGDRTTLIAILASCGTLLAMIIGLGIYATHHRKPYSENQQHLTEELHTVENGYHDNPTLEVMEVQPEMQEKKKPPCSECNEGYIVPMETALKEEFLDEEDTHL